MPCVGPRRDRIGESSGHSYDEIVGRSPGLLLPRSRWPASKSAEWYSTIPRYYHGSTVHQHQHGSIGWDTGQLPCGGCEGVFPQREPREQRPVEAVVQGSAEIMDLRFVYSPLPVILASLMRNVISYSMEERDRTRVTVLYLMKGNSERFIQ